MLFLVIAALVAAIACLSLTFYRSKKELETVKTHWELGVWLPAETALLGLTSDYGCWGQGWKPYNTDKCQGAYFFSGQELLLSEGKLAIWLERNNRRGRFLPSNLVVWVMIPAHEAESFPFSQRGEALRLFLGWGGAHQLAKQAS